MTGPSENPANILLSVKPVYAEKMLSGEKAYEYRRVIPSAGIGRIAVYSSSPAKRIVAVADAEGVLSGSPEAVWQSTGECGGVSRAEFDAYFRGRGTAHAIRLGKVRPLPCPVAIGWYGLCLARPPQSFRYLTDEEMSFIEAMFDVREHVLAAPVKAVQVTEENRAMVAEWCHGHSEPLGWVEGCLDIRYDVNELRLFNVGKDCVATAFAGDWIVETVDDHRWPSYWVVRDKLFKTLFRPKE
jgi:predicted transcriptional regulator